jgi:hypothetical protein
MNFRTRGLPVSKGTHIKIDIPFVFGANGRGVKFLYVHDIQSLSNLSNLGLVKLVENVANPSATFLRNYSEQLIN